MITLRYVAVVLSVLMLFFSSCTRYESRERSLSSHRHNMLILKLSQVHRLLPKVTVIIRKRRMSLVLISVKQVSFLYRSLLKIVVVTAWSWFLSKLFWSTVPVASGNF